MCSLAEGWLSRPDVFWWVGCEWGNVWVQSYTLKGWPQTCEQVWCCWDSFFCWEVLYRINFQFQHSEYAVSHESFSDCNIISFGSICAPLNQPSLRMFGNSPSLFPCCSPCFLPVLSDRANLDVREKNYHKTNFCWIKAWRYESASRTSRGTLVIGGCQLTSVDVISWKRNPYMSADIAYWLTRCFLKSFCCLFSLAALWVVFTSPSVFVSHRANLSKFDFA